MKKHVHIRVTGRVQGVNFRATARAKAEELSIRGFARNEPDGSVVIEAEGEEDVLEQFLAWCRQGPRLASVERVDIEQGEIQHFHSFEVQ